MSRLDKSRLVETDIAPPRLKSLGCEDWVIPGLLQQWVREDPDRPFLQYENEEPWSFLDVQKRVELFAAGLASLGVSKGDRVLLMMDNSLDFIFAWFAANQLGAIEVPINTANRGTFLEHVVNNSGGHVLFIDECYLPYLEEIGDRLSMLDHIIVRGLRAEPGLATWIIHPLDEFAVSGNDAADVQITYRDIAAIMYTSGTTGPAKGVLMPHAHMMMFAHQTVEQLQITRDDTFLICLPLFHGNAQLVGILVALLSGCKAVLYPRFSATRWVEQVRESGATASSLLGVMAQFLWDQPASPEDSQHCLTRMVTIPLPAGIAAEFENRFGVRCLEAYGMTEVTLPVFSSLQDKLRPGAAGRVQGSFYDVRIVDPATDEEVPAGQAGEIVVRPTEPWIFMQGYHAMPDETQDAWRNLWFHTGDEGRFDDDGFLYFRDRIRDRIRRRGENVSSYEVEAVIATYPGVQECAVVAVPAPEGDDDIVACLVPAAGVSLDPVSLLNHCKLGMPYFAVPRFVRVLDKLPKTPSGKILKRQLRSEGFADAWDRETVQYDVKGETVS